MPDPNQAIATLARILRHHLGAGLNQFDTRQTDEQRETLEGIVREFEGEPTKDAADGNVR